MRDVDWFKISLLFNLATIVLVIFPELVVTTRVFLFLSYSLIATTIGILYYRVGEILLTHFWSISISISAGIIFLFVLIRLKRNVDRYALQRLEGQEWKTLREFRSPVEKTCLKIYLPGSYRLMKLGAVRCLQKQIWQAQKHPKISLKYLHSVAEREEGHRG